MNRSLLLVGLLAGTFAVGCATPTAEDGDSQQDAIKGGEEDASKANSVVQIFAEQTYADGTEGANHYCTGTVLSPTAILTTA